MAFFKNFLSFFLLLCVCNIALSATTSYKADDKGGLLRAFDTGIYKRGEHNKAYGNILSPVDNVLSKSQSPIIGNNQVSIRSSGKIKNKSSPSASKKGVVAKNRIGSSDSSEEEENQEENGSQSNEEKKIEPDTNDNDNNRKPSGDLSSLFQIPRIDDIIKGLLKLLEIGGQIVKALSNFDIMGALKLVIDGISLLPPVKNAKYIPCFLSALKALLSRMQPFFKNLFNVKD